MRVKASAPGGFSTRLVLVLAAAGVLLLLLLAGAQDPRLAGATSSAILAIDGDPQINGEVEAGPAQPCLSLTPGDTGVILDFTFKRVPSPGVSALQFTFNYDSSRVHIAGVDLIFTTVNAGFWSRDVPSSYSGDTGPDSDGAYFIRVDSVPPTNTAGDGLAVRLRIDIPGGAPAGSGFLNIRSDVLIPDTAGTDHGPNGTGEIHLFNAEVRVAPDFCPRGPLDHFQCYDINAPLGAESLTLTDQFGTLSPSGPTLGAYKLFCNPVEKAHGDKTTFVKNYFDHFIFYTLNPIQPQPIREVLVENQFGRQSLTLFEAVELAVPTRKFDLPGPLPGLDHFLCYRAEFGAAPNVPVGLYDQFGTKADWVVGVPRRLCNPVEKLRHETGETTLITHPDDHLVCYDIPTHPVSNLLTVQNQFGRVDNLVVRGGPLFLCVPSLKILPTPPVGGVAEVLTDGGNASASRGSSASVPPYVAIAGGAAAGIIVAAAGGWYLRRRFRRS